jgi:hypothetical protein
MLEQKSHLRPTPRGSTEGEEEVLESEEEEEEKEKENQKEGNQQTRRKQRRSSSFFGQTAVPHSMTDPSSPSPRSK